MKMATFIPLSPSPTSTAIRHSNFISSSSSSSPNIKNNKQSTNVPKRIYPRATIPTLPSKEGASPVLSASDILETARLLVTPSEQGPRRLSILGSTGSIGTQTLDLVRERPDMFSVSSLSAGRNVDLLASQAREFQPSLICIQDETLLPDLKSKIESIPECKNIRCVSGSEGIIETAAGTDSHVVVTGIVGCAGLLPTVAAIEAGKDIALANKETLIAGGPVVVPLVKHYGCKMTAADSEHSAIFQCLQGAPEKSLRRIILTASGGAFRDLSKQDLEKVELKDALKHPNWTMGAKITIDSASMYNKAAEVIEAHYLFGIDYDNIDAIIHKQSIIHSMVEFQDMSVLAQLGWPDMRLPLLYSISWPHRVNIPSFKPLDLVSVGSLTFDSIDRDKYPNMDLAYRAGRAAGTMTCVLNAANEAAVEMFREERIHFLDIAKVNEAMMDMHRETFIQDPTLEDIVHFDKVTRTIAREFVDAGNLRRSIAPIV